MRKNGTVPTVQKYKVNKNKILIKADLTTLIKDITQLHRDYDSLSIN